MIYYTSIRPIDGKAKKVIVDENGKVINRYPNKDDLIGINKEPRKNRDTTICAKQELLNKLRQFYDEYKRPPTSRDLINNPEYPGFRTYQQHFGSFQKALKLVELDVDSMVKVGILETCQQKARFAEIMVLNHFKEYPIDLAGNNCNSSYDGICPNGKSYDVKSSKFDTKKKCYVFGTNNVYREEIEIYYFLAFNENWTKLDYAWRIPGEIIEDNNFYVGLKRSKFNIENMVEYDITDKVKDILRSK